ncbi:M23 family metallopeptidase [Patescibacteria group bacterium]|nr:M23 family metallopeptidase [Patescibacteria group bacterium]
MARQMIYALAHYPRRVLFALLAFCIVLPLTVQAGVLTALFGEGASTLPARPQEAATTSAIDVPLLSAQRNPNPQGARGGAEIIVREGALVSSGPIGADDVSSLSLTSGEISVYTVREGDSLSMIAEMFGVTSNTILWANDLTSAKSIRPGDSLVILPIPGVQYKIKRGDTIASIAKTYGGEAEEILAYNQLSESDLQSGITIIIPGGTVPAPKRTTTSGTKTAAAGGGATGFIHPLPGSLRTQGIHGFNAVDLAAAVGAPIRAAAAGEVIVAKTGGWNGGYGNYIVVRHSNGTQTLYAHNSSNAVGVGAAVAAGEVIGYVGNTGRSTGSHLHFEVRGAKNPF